MFGGCAVYNTKHNFNERYMYQTYRNMYYITFKIWQYNVFVFFLNQLVNQLDMYSTSINVLLNSSDISIILTTILNTNDKFSNNIYFKSKHKWCTLNTEQVYS